MEAAQAAFGEYLAISRRLAEQDPSNAGWQRGLAISCLRVARLEACAGRREAALALYEESLVIYSMLVAIAPGNPAWAAEKDMIEAELGGCRSGA